MSKTASLGTWFERGIEAISKHYDESFTGLTHAIDSFTYFIEGLLLWPPAWGFIAVITVLGFMRVSLQFSVFTALALSYISYIDLWKPTMQTLSLIMTASFICCLIGIPLGVLAARSKTAKYILRPVLDIMQTMPSFIFLIPAVIFFGIGSTAGIIATIIFALPPIIRLTSLGLESVPKSLKEAGRAFGMTHLQALFKIEIPHAYPSILMGINQTILMSLSMVIIASMIGAEGLGTIVLQSIQTLNIAQGFDSGFSIVIIAITIDRISQGRKNSNKISTAVRGSA